ncbi:DNRLRE domain-containing protein [Gramella sp. KN1008]|uniref:CBM96 family carbohydrate-binding protein n=1 Tax=Gramella sp. KN1008 TaxID=2529298 RepID=UPI00103FA44D|nr:DNRLRE domain-containing protein [Gramella sp. KN1008]TBW28628.1 DNRLRE domain-containing protein [Gramella sp. KN1008]
MKNSNIIKFSLIGICLGIFFSCEIQENFEYQKSGITGELGVTAWDYIQSHDSLVMLEQAVRIADLEDIYAGTSAKTFIAPTNTAFKEYLNSNSYTSLEEVPVPILRNALKYHIVKDVVLFTDPDLMESNNPIPYVTENGQTMFLSHNSNFQGVVNEGTSKQWTIVTSNLQPTNGAMHVVSSIVYFSAPMGDLSPPDPSVKTDTIFPIHDTYINGGSKSGDNFGGDALLKVKNVTGDGDYDRKSFLMFDLKDFDEEGVITDLKLELAVKYTRAKGVSLDLYSVNDTLWEESSLTFDNATLPGDTEDPIASLTTSKINTFEFNITDYFNDLESKQRISLMLDGEAGTDETDEFASKENTDFNMPMLIATIASGDNLLEIETNTGFTVGKGEAYAFSNAILEISGAAPEDIIFEVEETPQHGWLIRGADILQVGDRFTQKDIEVMNLLYINDNSGSEDKLVLSARDRAGSRLDPFEMVITIE